MIIKLNKINKFYGYRGNKIKALNSIDLEIEEGKFISIMGPSGCGKSTLLNVLGCIDSPDNGEYYLKRNKIDFKKINSLSEIRNRDIAMIFQNFALIGDLSVMENCLLPLKFRKEKSKYKKEVVEKYLKELGLYELRKKRVAELSGGQQQRVAIVRALAQETDIILADEPTGALDEQNTKSIMELLKKLNKEFNKTIIVVTHDKLVASYSDKTLFMKDGKILKLNIEN